MFLCLHAFGDDAQPEVVREPDGRSHDRIRLGFASEIEHERLVDLYRIDGKFAEITERRETGTEVIDVNLDAGMVKRLQYLE